MNQETSNVKSAAAVVLERLVRVLSWIPVLGVIIELSRKDKYLSDRRHPWRFVLSAMWVWGGIPILVWTIIKAL